MVFVARSYLVRALFFVFSPRNGEPSTPQPSPMGDSRAAEAFFFVCFSFVFCLALVAKKCKGLAVQPHCPILSGCSLSLRKFKIQLDHWKGGFDALTSMNLYPADPTTVATNSVLEDYPARRLHGPLWDQSSSQCFFHCMCNLMFVFHPSFLVR